MDGPSRRSAASSAPRQGREAGDGHHQNNRGELIIPYSPPKIKEKAAGREGKKMENIIREVMRAMEHGIRRDEAVNDAANIHAANYDEYCALYNALEAAIPT